MNKKADFIFLITIIIIAAVLWLALHYLMQAPGGMAVVSVNGEEYGRYDLNHECTISIPGADGGYNLLVISNHSASVTDADCPDKLCVRQKSADRQGESIICLPHRMVVRVEQGKEGELDGITY